MKMYLVRHGQTNINKERLIQGRVDAPLNAVGIKQAKNAGQALKALKIDFDKIISSPLSRALETGHLIARKLNYKDNIHIIPKLVERDFGAYEMTAIADNFPRINADDFREKFYEDNALLKERVLQALKQLYLQYKDKSVIITAHAHIIRTVYIIFDAQKFDYNNFFLGNGSIHLFNYDGLNLELLNTYNNEE